MALLVFFLFIVPLSVVTANLIDQELQDAASALRSRGYTLFPNAIDTSCLRPHLLSSPNSSFTLFAPPDRLLSSLDLSSTALHYTRSLLYHVSPLRLSTSDLLSLPNGTRLATLLPRHTLLLNSTTVSVNASDFDSVIVSETRISVPDLFLGSTIAVHGLDGVLVAEFGSGKPHDDDFGVLGLDTSSIYCFLFYSPASSPAMSPAWSEPLEIVTGGLRSRIDRRQGHSHKRGKSQRGSSHDGDDRGSGNAKFSKFTHRFNL